MNFIHNIRSSYGEDVRESDRGDLVQTVLITAGFAIAAIVIIGWIVTALMNKGADTASCIEGANNYASGGNGVSDTTKTACSTNHADGNSYQDDKSYSSRYGSGTGTGTK